jgi:hypothetical protein
MNRFVFRYLRGVTAIDLLMVFAITCICVVAGTPFVSNYAVRSRLAEAIIVAESARAAVTVACTEEPNLGKLSNQAVGFTFAGARYVSDVELTGSCAEARIRLLTVNTGAEPDPVVTLIGVSGPGNNRIDWTCSSSGRDLHMPKGCRH